MLADLESGVGGVYCSVAQACGESVGRQAARGSATLRVQSVVEVWARPTLTGDQGEVQVMARQVAGSVKQVNRLRYVADGVRAARTTIAQCPHSVREAWKACAKHDAGGALSHVSS